jgi:galactonate dehydratase
MRVTDIEVHPISLEHDPDRAYELDHYFHIRERTIYVAHTDNGLTGLGESGTPEDQETVEKYIGTNPFDWIGDEISLGLGTAMYDLMGKAAGVPVYKLFGQKYRSWVPVSSWTVSTHPDRMAAAAKQYADAGHTWMKFHLSPFENVVRQTEAIQAVVPPDFRLHYDFTMHGTTDHMPDLLETLAAYPVAGCFEDPLPGEDIDGYVELRRRSRLPIVLHHFPSRATYEVFHRPGDAYMLGHYVIGDAVRRAGLFAADDSPFMLQNVGGTITRAMIAHMMVAFPSATLHSVSASETWRSDVVTERLNPINGVLRVPEEPGLGLTLDRDELDRLKALSLPPLKSYILKTVFGNGVQMLNLAEPDNPLFLVRPDRSRKLPMSYAAPISTEYWDDDGSAEFAAAVQRIKQEDTVLIVP